MKHRQRVRLRVEDVAIERNDRVVGKKQVEVLECLGNCDFREEYGMEEVKEMKNSEKVMLSENEKSYL